MARNLLDFARTSTQHLVHPPMILTGSDLTCKALDIAMEAHRGQFRANGVTPYIEHPQDVRSRFHNSFMAYDERDERYFHGVALAYCHDVLEDGSLTLDQLCGMGLESIREELALLTHNKADSYLDYILKLKHSGNNLAIHVKLCDIAANLATVDQVPDQRYAKCMRTKWELSRHILTNP